MDGRLDLLGKVIRPREGLVAVWTDVRTFLGVGAHVPKLTARVEASRQPKLSSAGACGNHTSPPGTAEKRNGW
jgi:hypothetical protein